MDIARESISPELLEKAEACSTPEELLALAKSEGVELGDEQLEIIAGGSWSNADVDDDYVQCPRCGAKLSTKVTTPTACPFCGISL